LKNAVLLLRGTHGAARVGRTGRIFAENRILFRIFRFIFSVLLQCTMQLLTLTVVFR
jgi:hypothetical protein